LEPASWPEAGFLLAVVCIQFLDIKS